MDARLQLRVQRYGWDRAAPSYELAWEQALEPATAAVLNAAKLRSVQFAVPPRAVQDGVVERLDRAYELLSERERIDSETKDIPLRDAILRKAFAGEL